MNVTNMHASIPEEKLTEAYRLLLEMRDNCVKHADDQYDDPKREDKREALNIAITAMGRSVPPRWIIVEDEPPKNVYLQVYVAKFGCVEKAKHEGLLWRTSGGEGLNIDWVTHWMPLPEPPKEEET